MKNAMWRKWLIVLAATVLVMTAAVSVFQITVDPFGVWNVYQRNGFNNFKSSQYETERVFKPYQYASTRPEVAIFGSSRVNYCTPARWPGVDDSRVYNYGINAAHIPEYYRYLESALRTHKPRVITVSFDFLQFSSNYNEPLEGFSQQRLDMVALSSFTGFLHKASETILSVDSIMKSVETIKASRRAPQAVYFMRGWEHRSKSIRRNWQNYRRLLYGYTRGTYRSFEWSDSNEALFDEMMELVRRSNVEYHIYINPISVDFLTAIDINGKWNDFERFKRLVVDKSGRVFDFNYVNSVTSDRNQFVDPSHFLPGIAGRMFEIIHSGRVRPDSDFGIVLTRANIDDELRKQRALYQRWRDEHPTDVALVEFALKTNNRNQFYSRAILILGK